MIGYRLSGTVDARKCRCNLPPGGGKLHLRHLTMIGYRLSGIVDARFLERKDTITAEGLLRNEEYILNIFKMPFNGQKILPMLSI